MERDIYVRNINVSFNKGRPIKHMAEVNIYYQGYRKRIDRKSKDNKMSRKVWKAVKTKVGKIGMTKSN